MLILGITADSRWKGWPIVNQKLPLVLGELKEVPIRQKSLDLRKYEWWLVLTIDIDIRARLFCALDIHLVGVICTNCFGVLPMHRPVFFLPLELTRS